jgi:hypothetical protein
MAKASAAVTLAATGSAHGALAVSVDMARAQRGSHMQGCDGKAAMLP